jgi:hypothetical protein
VLGVGTDIVNSKQIISVGLTVNVADVIPGAVPVKIATPFVNVPPRVHPVVVFVFVKLLTKYFILSVSNINYPVFVIFGLAIITPPALVHIYYH